MTRTVRSSIAGLALLGGAAAIGLGIAALEGPHVSHAEVSWALTPRAEGPGSIACVSLVPRGQAGTCWIEPSPGARLVSVVDNGHDVTAVVQRGEYAISPVVTAHEVVAVFADGGREATEPSSGLSPASPGALAQRP